MEVSSDTLVWWWYVCHKICRCHDNMYLWHKQNMLHCTCFWSCPKLEVIQYKLFLCSCCWTWHSFGVISDIICSLAIYTQSSWYVKCILLLLFMKKYIVLCDVSKLCSKITCESIMKYTDLLTICIYQVKTTWCFVHALELAKVAS